SENVLFASEMIGAVRTVDPTTGFNFDDTVRYITDADLSAEERQDIFERNARRVYPRLDARLSSHRV
ncbi:amidohydrolase family protein, partial [Brevibacterium sp.]|uniref:amidohydrolase family protein n=1 Tax=Brevibacterium sp. TaxID=1701 RepID=UPI002648A814